jgi:hypothetical protein
MAGIELSAQFVLVKRSKQAPPPVADPDGAEIESL